MSTYLPSFVRGPKPPPKTVSKKARAEVISRDGLSCRYCCRSLAENEVTIDHIVSRKRGGRSNLENLCVACRSCNSSKSANYDRPGDHVLSRSEALRGE